jgi:cytoskeletal protein RodZ
MTKINKLEVDSATNFTAQSDDRKPMDSDARSIISLGEELKSIREAARVSIDELSDRIKIRRLYIEMLENDDFSNLPSSTYVVGFIKSYCGFFDTDYRDFIKDYNKFYKLDTDNLDTSNSSVPKPDTDNSLAKVFLIVGLLLMGIIVVITSFYQDIVATFGLEADRQNTATVITSDQTAVENDEVSVEQQEIVNDFDSTTSPNPRVRIRPLGN